MDGHACERGQASSGCSIGDSSAENRTDTLGQESSHKKGTGKTKRKKKKKSPGEENPKKLEVLRQIKGDSTLKMIPVVMMTSSREEQDLLRSYQLGVNAYVVKPMKFQDFVEAVKEVGAFWGVINEVPPGSLRRNVAVGSSQS